MATTTAGCTEVEREVLAEYVRLSGNIEKLADLTQELSLAQPALLERLRPLEKKLGLVFTLFKASVFANLRAQAAKEEEAEAAQRAAEARAEDSDNSM